MWFVYSLESQLYNWCPHFLMWIMEDGHWDNTVLMYGLETGTNNNALSSIVLCKLITSIMNSFYAQLILGLNHILFMHIMHKWIGCSNNVIWSLYETILYLEWHSDYLVNVAIDCKWQQALWAHNYVTTGRNTIFSDLFIWNKSKYRLYNLWLNE